MFLRFSKFQKEHFPEYKSWFEDAELNMRLGPMDDAWLEYVTRETDGCQYSVFCGEELIAVVGIKYPTAKHPEYYLTDFAMKPALRSKGIGSKVLRELLRMHSDRHWKAFVDVRNPRAKTFFERHGWACVSNEPDTHGMLTLKLKAINS